MAVDYLSAINRQGSGLNITELVDSLVEAETAPQVEKIQKDIDNRNAAISGYAIVANELGKLKNFGYCIKHTCEQVLPVLWEELNEIKNSSVNLNDCRKLCYTLLPTNKTF